MSHSKPSDTTEDGVLQFSQQQQGSVQMRAKQLEASLVLQDPSTAPSSNTHSMSYTTGALQHLADHRTPLPVSSKPKTERERQRRELTQSCIEPLTSLGGNLVAARADGSLQSPPSNAGHRTPPPVSPKPKTERERQRRELTQSCIEPLTSLGGNLVAARADGSPQSPPNNPLKSATAPKLLVTEPNYGNLSLKASRVQSDKKKLPLTQSIGNNGSPIRTSALVQRPPKPQTKPKPRKPTPKSPAKFNGKTSNEKFSSQANVTGSTRKTSLAHIAGKGIQKLFHNINPRGFMLKLLGTTQEGTEQENLDVEVELQLPKVLTDELKHSKDFQPIVELILKRLLDFNDIVQFEEPDVLKQTGLQLHEKKVLISAFGCHNAGKSTLLNALLGNRLLPVSQMNETSVTVEIQHDGSVHQGPCTASGSTCKRCPFLVETRKSSADDTSRSVTNKQLGVSNIYNTLKSINKTVRGTTKVCADTEYTIHTNVPMIQAPPSWKVHLVDNAGFGEAGQEGIIKQANTALVTSSAYVYVMTYESLGDSKDVAAFQRIYDKDRGVFTDRRLLVVVTHFDKSYTQEMEDQVLSQDQVREQVYNAVKGATESTVLLTKDDIVLVSGMWAYVARKLLYTHDDDPNLKRRAQNYLMDFGTNPSTAISTQDLAKQLEEASGITSVEQRIKEMASACLRIWVENIKKSCSLYITKACHAFEGASQSCEEYNEANIMTKYEEKDKDHKKLKAAQEKLEQSKSGKDSAIYKELETAYQKDIHKESLLSGVLQTADDAIKEFSKSCKEKCATNYKPTDFASDVENFLERTSKELVGELSRSNFESVSSCFATQREDIGEKTTQLMAAVGRFCATDEVNFTPQSTSQKSLSDVLKTDEIPSCLKDLNIKLPTLTGFEKARRWLRNLFMKEGAGLREEEIDGTVNELKTELENGCKNYLTKVQPDVLDFYYGQYTARVESVLEIFNHECSFHIEQQEQAMKKMHEELMSNRKEIETIQQWLAYLEKLHDKLYRSAEEFLKHENAAFQGHDPFALPDPVSEKRVDAVTAQSDAGFLTVYFHQHKTTVLTQAGCSVLNILEHPAKEWDITLVPGSYVLYTDDRESNVDWSTDSTAFSGCNVYIEFKETTTELETGERPPDIRRTRSRSFSETVDGPSNDRQSQSRGWSTDALLDSELEHEKLPNETVDSQSDTTPTQHRLRSETVDGVSHQEMGNEALPSESPHHEHSKVKQKNSSRRQKRKDSVSWWNRSQKGRPVPTCEPEAQKVPNFEDDFKEDLLSICEVAKNRLQQLQTELPKSHVLNLVTAELVHLWKQAEEREILIAVLGYYNSGKSSLLNALAGDKILPVSMIHETEMKVKLQYDGKLHKGCCKKDSFDELSPSFCESCPVLFDGGEVEVCKGASAIVSHLQQVHKSLQQNPEKNAEEYAIHVNIPILNCIPSPWQLCLVDNPSFKELTEIGMQEELQDEVMALSAYIYTAPYKQLIDAVDANAFKLISEKDQAKAAFLQERLVIAVTHFEAYYTAAFEANEKPNVQHVQELVCTTIKKATSRDFPLESVVPVCSQWAFVAKKLLCQPQNKNLLQKALRWLEVCPDEYTESLSKDDVHPLLVARKLEAASGIKQLELRIMELARKACDESKYRITNVFSGYLKVAVKNLSHILNEPEETAIGRTKFVSDQARINLLKGELKKHTNQKDSPAYQSLCSQCNAEIEDLSRQMEDECKILVQSFQEKCATKIATRGEEIFGSAELEKDIAEFVNTAYEHLQAYLNRETFQKSTKAFYDSISEVDELFVKMLGLAQNLHHDPTDDNMPQTAGKHLEVVPSLSALKKLPLLQPDKLKKEVDIPRSGNRFLRRTKSYTSEGQLQRVIKQLESYLLQWLKAALLELQAIIIRLLFGHLSDYAKEGLKTFTDKFGDVPMESGEVEKLQRLHSWQKHLQDLKKHLEKKSEEDLAAREEILCSYSSL